MIIRDADSEPVVPKPLIVQMWYEYDTQDIVPSYRHCLFVARLENKYGRDVGSNMETIRDLMLSGF